MMIKLFQGLNHRTNSCWLKQVPAFIFDQRPENPGKKKKKRRYLALLLSFSLRLNEIERSLHLFWINQLSLQHTICGLTVWNRKKGRDARELSFLQVLHDPRPVLACGLGVLEQQVVLVVQDWCFIITVHHSHIFQISALMWVCSKCVFYFILCCFFLIFLCILHTKDFSQSWLIHYNDGSLKREGVWTCHPLFSPVFSLYQKEDCVHRVHCEDVQLMHAALKL